METENSASTAAPGEDWDPAAEEQQESGGKEQRDVSPVECAPAVGAEVVCPGTCSGEGSHPQSEVKRRGKRRQKQAASRPEDKHCSCCRVQFERQGRSFNRRALCTFTTLETVRWALPHAVELHEKSFLCETCAQVVRSKCKRKQSGKRTLWVKPIDKKQTEPRAQPKERRMGKKSRAALLVSKSCYKAAFRVLWSAKGARKPMMDFLSKQLKLEMKALSRQAGSPFHQKVASTKPLAMFPWRRCLNWAQEKAPLVSHCIRSMFPDTIALSKSSHLSEDQARTLLERRTVTALSIPLFSRNVYKNNFLQASLGAELRLQGCSGSGLDSLNALGLCQNKDTVRLLLLRLLQGPRRRFLTNGRLGQKLKQEQLKAARTPDVEEDNEEEEEEEEEESDGESETESDSEPDQMEPEVPVPPPEEEEEEEEEEETKRKRRKRMKKRKHRDEDDGDDEDKKRRVVVVRLGLLPGHSDP